LSDIFAFEGEHRWLSNFSDSPVVLDGVQYPSVENAYQAAKTTDPAQRRPFEQCTAGESKRKGHAVKLRKYWDLIKIPIMLGLLRQKFRTPQRKVLLDATESCWLEEGNRHGDRFFGTVNRKGENYLGRLIMLVREFPEEIPMVDPHLPVLVYSSSAKTIELKSSLFSASAELKLPVEVLGILLNSGCKVDGFTLWTALEHLEFWVSLDSKKP
jgi:N-glycosidase YbiA